ncbi:MAG: lysophospholipid acyltransferase family protein, partial [Alloprevotella sp.]|nr:lysophospholipid acyltransferase family protein [Alloprevotella sp.]
MVIEGVDEMERSLETKPFVFIFLGHYCNWEWVSSIPLWYQKEDSHGAQLYRPLKNKAFDGLFLEMRSRFGSENISKYEALRHILQLRRDGKKTCIGFISDQTPGWNSIHDWVDFLHQDTPVFTGTERIAKKVDAAIFFADIRRVRRGYYHLVLRRMTDEPKDFPDYALTEQYMRELEQIIRRQPHLWLWSHRRWKHRRAADGSRLDN